MKMATADKRPTDPGRNPGNKADPLWGPREPAVKEMLDHIALLLAKEYVKAMKQDQLADTPNEKETQP